MFASAIIMTIKVTFVIWAATMAFDKLVKPHDGAWLKRKPLAILIVLYVIAMFASNLYIVYLAMVLTLPIAARNRGEAAALFMIAIASIPELGTGLRIGGSSIVQMDKWLFFSLGLGLVMVMKPQRGLRFSGRFDIPFLLLIGLELLQARGGNLTSVVRSILTTLLTIGLPYFVLTRSITKVEDLRKVMMALAYLGFVLACVGVFESRSHFLAYLQLYDRLGIPQATWMFKMRAGMLRPITTFGDATSFSLVLVMMMMATIVCRESFRSTSKFAIALLVITLGIFVTSSRNAWIALVIGVLAFDLYRGRTVALIGKATVLAMGYALILLLAEISPYFAAMTGKSNDTASTSIYRNQLLTRGIEEFRKHPLAGIDPTTLLANMHDMVQGEGIVDFVNGYLYYSLIAGFGGLVALVLAFILPIWAMLKSRRSMMVQGRLLQRSSAFVFAMAVVMLITTVFTAFGGHGSTFFYLALGIGGVLYAWRKVPPELLAASDRPVYIAGQGMVTLRPLTAERPVRGRRGPRRSRALPVPPQLSPASEMPTSTA